MPLDSDSAMEEGEELGMPYFRGDDGAIMYLEFVREGEEDDGDEEEEDEVMLMSPPAASTAANSCNNK